MNSYSQIKQDLIVLDILGYKREGTFVDIGCGPPIHINNTYLMESEYGWSGFSVDFNEEEKPKWVSDRPDSSMIIADALVVDFLEKFKENNLPPVIDYLSYDLEPPEVTFESVQRIPFDEYTFNVITYEHDGYRMGDTFKQESRDFFDSKGYVLVHELNNQDDIYMSQDFYNEYSKG